MSLFHQFGLHETLTKSLDAINFTTPTPIQQEAIPVALKGQDILGSAQTGTGKTAAFGIPAIEHLINNPESKVLIMTPTRELASQVLKNMRSFMQHVRSVKSALLIGGDSMGKQLHQLRGKPRLIVGTPGRINDHIERGTLLLDTADYIVLDETDRMLDMGFSEQIDAIVEVVAEKRQTLLFSATLPKAITRLAKNYLNDPKQITIGTTSTPAANIKQEFIHLKQNQKRDGLVEQLRNREGSVVMFVKTKQSADDLAKWLREKDFKAKAIHGDMRQRARDFVIQGFRKSKFRILVATDVAARGLDVPHIEHVINFDMPQCAEDYIHRIGRTARAGAKGEAVSFIAPADKGSFHAVQRLLDPEYKGGNEGSDRRGGNRRGGPRRGNGNKDGGGYDWRKKRNNSSKKPFKFKKKANSNVKLTPDASNNPKKQRSFKNKKAAA